MNGFQCEQQKQVLIIIKFANPYNFYLIMSILRQFTQLPPNTTQFIRKLCAMIQQSPQTISLSSDGTQIHVHDHNKFTHYTLPSFFRHSNWASFIRQMNMYGFRKINRSNQAYIFINKNFRKGNQCNFNKIKRRSNGKEDQLEHQRQMENQFKAIIQKQCDNLSKILRKSQANAHDTKTMHFSNKINNKQTEKSRGFQSVINPNPVNSLSKFNTMPEITPSNIFSELDPNTKSVSSTNSILYFLNGVLNLKLKMGQALMDVRTDMQNISKQRKFNENKNIISVIKNSGILIQETKHRLKNQIENYVESYQNEDQNYTFKSMKKQNKGEKENGIAGGEEAQNNNQSNNRSKKEINSDFNIPDPKPIPQHISPAKLCQPIVLNNLNNNIENTFHLNYQSEPTINNKNIQENIKLNEIESFNSSSSFHATLTHPNPPTYPRQIDLYDSIIIPSPEQNQRCTDLNRVQSSDFPDRFDSVDDLVLGKRKSSFEPYNNFNLSSYNPKKFEQIDINDNKLGVSPLCSFNSVTNLLQFEKQ